MTQSPYLPKTVLSVPTSYLLLSGALLVVLFFSGFLVLAGLLLANIALASLIRPLKKFAVGYGIELITLSAVVAGMAYGVKAGIIVGAISMLANFIAMRRLSKFSVVVLPLYIVIGAVAGLLHGAPIVVVGIGLVITYNLIISAIILVGFRGSPIKCATFSLTNIAWNAIIFSALGAPLLALAG